MQIALAGNGILATSANFCMHCLSASVLATVLLLLIYALRRRDETLAIRGLSITAAVYLCFHLVAVGQLLISP